MNGILPLWKPKGMTSHDCVMKVRKIFQTKKVGHTGTLDPDAEGVLPICIGEATKIVPFLTDTKKTYVAEVRLGIATDTLDATGKVVKQIKLDKFPDKQEIEDVLVSFQGEITQIPPMYSAVKVKGKKLYEYARKDQSVERPKRLVTIEELKLINCHRETFTIRVVCSKGTYIRTLCVDICEKLGYPAHMSKLRRTKVGSFAEEDCLTFSQIERAAEEGNRDALLLPIVRGIDHLDTFIVDEETKRRVLHGQKLPKPEKSLKTNPFAVLHQNSLLAIYEIHPQNKHVIKPVRVFRVNGKSEVK